VQVAEAGACKTVVSLETGSVAVHAKDLGGGEFVVRARDGQVVVKGTVFAVTQTADAFVVEVSEGRVSVRDRTGEHAVDKGGRYALRAGRSETGRLDGARDGEIRGAVDLPRIVGFDSLLPAAPPEAAAVAGRAPSGSSVGAAERVAVVESGEPEAQEVALPEPVAPSAGTTTVDLLTEAETARRSGRFDAARELYRRAALGQGATAEAAWVALARMELALGNASQARAATKQRQQRFGQGTLAPESLWIDVRAYRLSGEFGLARELAAELSRRWPGSPQARAAEDWLSSPR
jgi:hypothetical protein